VSRRWMEGFARGVATEIAEQRKSMRAHLEKRIMETVEMLAEEIATLNKGIRAEFAEQLGQLRAEHAAELMALREEIKRLKEAQTEERSPWPERRKATARRHAAH
jgi:DNA anti-recombination protein RmuC